MKSKRDSLDAIKTLMIVVMGNTIYALTVKLFLLPANLMSSGTTGIALIVNHITGLAIPTFVLIFNIFMLIVGLVLLGKKFAMTTVVSSLVYPIALDILDGMLGDVHVTDNAMLNVLFAGMGIGLSLGIVIKAGASTGGMDIPPLVLNKFFRIPVSVSLYVFDFIILTGQMFYHPLEDLLYGIILLLTTSLVLDKVVLMGTTKTEVKIISNRIDEIREQIIKELDRGVTMLHGSGGYSNQETQVILSVVSNYELPKVEKVVRRIDPECFMIVSRVSEVWGRGFSLVKKYDTPKNGQDS